MTIKRIVVLSGIVCLSTGAFAREKAQLAVRMDDMGAFHSVNKAVMDAYSNGIARTVEVMPVTAWYPEAVKMLAEAPGLDVGIHLAITSEWENVKWRPLTQAPSLTDEHGYFWPMMFPNPAYPGQSVVENGFDPAELEAEFRAQIERVLADVPRVSHISGHMLSLMFDPKAKEIATRLAEEYGLAMCDVSGADADYTGVGYADSPYAMRQGKHRTLAEKENSFIKMLHTLKPGKKYMFIDHPAYDDSEMATVFHIGYEDVAVDRQGVTDLYKSERVKKAVEDCNVELITINQIKKSLPRAKTTEAAQAIDSFIAEANAKGLDVHSVMLLKDGNVIGEKWVSRGDPAVPHIMNSVSKTLTATAVGFAVAEGKLKLDDKVVSFFPDKLPKKVSDNLKDMTVRDLLTMNCGQEQEADVRRGDRDWVEAFLAQPVPHEPGTWFLYNSTGSFILSAIVQQAVGENVFSYLTPRLFNPLGITGIRWDESPGGINCGGWGAYLKTEDMAKIGQLFLNKGKWNGKQLLPEWWIEEASSRQVSSRPGGVSDEDFAKSHPEENDWLQGYGYQMWMCRHNAFRADGANGQYIIAIPEKNAVIAMTSDVDDMGTQLNLIWDILYPAI